MKDFKTLLYEVFPVNDFNVDMTQLDDDIDPDQEPITINIGSLQQNSFCTIFAVYKKEIGINKIEKCGISGSNILKKIEQFAKRCSVESIYLEDQSQIDVCREKRYSDRNETLDLATLKIVTTGQSWYNSLGYKSEYYEEERIINEYFMNTLYSDFINKQTPSLKEAGATLFPEIDVNQSVKSYFNHVLKIVKCGNHDQAKLLSDILDILKNGGYIAYNRDLTKTIDYKMITNGGSKKKRKPRRTRRSMRRSTNRRKKN